MKVEIEGKNQLTGFPSDMLQGEVLEVEDATLLSDGDAQDLSLFGHVLPGSFQHPDCVADVVGLPNTGQQTPHVTPTVRDDPHCPT